MANNGGGRPLKSDDVKKAKKAKHFGMFGQLPKG